MRLRVFLTASIAFGSGQASLPVIAHGEEAVPSVTRGRSRIAEPSRVSEPKGAEARIARLPAESHTRSAPTPVIIRQPTTEMISPTATAENVFAQPSDVRMETPPSLAIVPTMSSELSLDRPAITLEPSSSTTPDVQGGMGTDATLTHELPTVADKAAEGEWVARINAARGRLQRGALLTARHEGWSVLESMSSRHADQCQNDGPVAALNRARTALMEAGDFLTCGSTGDRTTLQRLIESHTTTTLKSANVSQLTPHHAADAYFDSARTLLMDATGGGPIASQALALIADSHLRAPTHTQEDRGVALTCLRAAMGGYPYDATLANQLGYELLQDGRLAEAEQVLRFALRRSPSQSAWQNLAEVQRRQGNLASAQQCAQAALAFGSMPPPGPEVIAMTPQQFARISPAPVMTYPASPSSVANSPTPVPSQSVPASGNRFATRFSDWWR